ncbi:MAG: flavin reductase family protein [candidate division Zixibacteria bacterium]|nr:flavin reductase family protein [candidate division Zixibacteria bacterium]NIR64920.1 flavin reductase family protein [candidate division Zixibacteria bacterium]NIS15443.1 flavin reductase family protein [candidate division Zixibacteria bacterium]NIS46726.1 flavin reductase family protein [candidate division Zixibacteria bacterium]NIT54086.1 flavin reductase family protein [candidate division Zixibacteria bacterium]
MKKVDFPIDKRKWHPGLIPGLIVLVSTYSKDSVPNIAPISWIQMASFEPPMLMFSGTKNSHTVKNILETECFCVNLVDSKMVTKVFNCIKWFGEERIKKCGFNLSDAENIKAPVVDESRAHLECTLYDTKEVGRAVIAFGEIKAASVWEEIATADTVKAYQKLDQVMYMEDSIYALFDRLHRIE